jgi:SHS family lactate transporter-like MFS transporter
MPILGDLRDLTLNQRNAVLASFLGWTLDAFDFFIIVFVLKDIAKEFKTDIPSVTATLFLTLAMRPLGAFLFGMMADRFGRRPTLMIDIMFYSVVEFLSGFAPSLTALVILRAFYGIAMGGEWGVGALPAFLVLFIRRNVEESPAWQQRRGQPIGMGATIKGRWKLFIYVIILMTAFNSFSHGTQDIYPTFLQVQQKYPPQVVSTIAVIYNLGAILGGLVFGAFSEQLGRRRAIVTAALLTLPVIPLWAFSNNVVLLSVGAFLLQFFVQGAWGVIPVHLNELSPDSLRGTFPGFTYQLGNFFASKNGTIQAALAVSYGNNYGLALAVTAGIVAIAVAAVTAFGPEARAVKFGQGHSASNSIAGEIP